MWGVVAVKVPGKTPLHPEPHPPNTLPCGVCGAVVCVSGVFPFTLKLSTSNLGFCVTDRVVRGRGCRGKLPCTLNRKGGVTLTYNPRHTHRKGAVTTFNRKPTTPLWLLPQIVITFNHKGGSLPLNVKVHTPLTANQSHTLHCGRVLLSLRGQGCRGNSVAPTTAKYLHPYTLNHRGSNTAVVERVLHA